MSEYTFDEVRIVEGGDDFILLDNDEKVFVIVDLDTANKMTDFESTNKWVQDAEDIYVNDLNAYVDEMTDVFGYKLIEEE